MTAIDHHSRFAMAVAGRGANSQTTADFVQLVERVFPSRIEQVLTDNGSEFKESLLLTANTGVSNIVVLTRAALKRFNRSLQEEFVEHHEGLLRGGFKFVQ